MLFQFLIYTQFLNKKQAFFRPASVSYKRGHYFENQGLVFLKFMFLICRTLLYRNHDNSILDVKNRFLQQISCSTTSCAARRSMVPLQEKSQMYRVNEEVKSFADLLFTTVAVHQTPQKQIIIVRPTSQLIFS